MYVCHIWFAIYHQYTPVMLVYIPYDWILWDWDLWQVRNQPGDHEGPGMPLNHGILLAGSRETQRSFQRCPDFNGCLEEDGRFSEMIFGDDFRRWFSEMVFGDDFRRWFFECLLKSMEFWSSFGLELVVYKLHMMHWFWGNLILTPAAEKSQLCSLSSQFCCQDGDFSGRSSSIPYI